MKEKIVIIGAGSQVFTRGLVMDMMRLNMDVDLFLVDINRQTMEAITKLTRKMVEARKASINITGTMDRKEVLKDATVVISTIGVGGRRAWEQDVWIPRKYGIYQPVGDTAMPGGTSRALRMIPAMVDIARDVLDLAPDALFINYANPMSVVCRGVRKATGADMIGLCHAVEEGYQYLAEALKVKRESLTFNSVGINHLTWINRVFMDGKDMMPELMKTAAEQTGNVDIENLGAHWSEMGEKERDQLSQQPFSWKLLQTFGAFPTPMDRHVTEFFPHLFQGEKCYHSKTLGIDAYSFEKTIEYGDKEFDEMFKYADSGEPLPKSYYIDDEDEDHELVMDIIKCIRENKTETFSANLPNKGQVPNLPADAIVEIQAKTSSNGLTPVDQHDFPNSLAATLSTRFLWIETIVEAALEGSRDKFIQALVLDGSVTSIDMAAKMADEFLEAQKEYLPQFSC